MWVESDTICPAPRRWLASSSLANDSSSMSSASSAKCRGCPTRLAIPRHCRRSCRPPASGGFSRRRSRGTRNRMPHHTFWWEGIDGSRVFTHFPPADTYGAELSGAELAHAERNFSEKGRATLSLIPFGWGDGGGGPTREMIAAAHRLASLEGSPTVTIDTPQAFFAQRRPSTRTLRSGRGKCILNCTGACSRANCGRSRGIAATSTCCARPTLGHHGRGAGGPRISPRRLERCWHTVLLLQFHDILPGPPSRLGTSRGRAQAHGCRRRARRR